MSWINNIMHEQVLGTFLLIVIYKHLPEHHSRVQFSNFGSAICSNFCYKKS